MYRKDQCIVKEPLLVGTDMYASSLMSFAFKGLIFTCKVACSESWFSLSCWDSHSSALVWKTRSSTSLNITLFSIRKCKATCTSFQRSFWSRAMRIWNTLSWDLGLTITLHSIYTTAFWTITMHELVKSLMTLNTLDLLSLYYVYFMQPSTLQGTWTVVSSLFLHNHILFYAFWVHSTFFSFLFLHLVFTVSQDNKLK